MSVIASPGRGGDRGWPFVKPQSGRAPRGSRNSAILAAEILLQDPSEALTQNVVEYDLITANTSVTPA